MGQHSLLFGNKQSGKLRNQNDIKKNVITGNNTGTIDQSCFIYWTRSVEAAETDSNISV